MELSPRVDVAFKKVFADPKNKDLLKSLINSIVSKEDKVKSFDVFNEEIFKRFGEEELVIIKNLSLWPKVIESSVINKEPHRVVYYLIELASVMHNFWSMGKVNKDLKIINVNDLGLTHARLILLNSVSTVIRAGLDIISIKPMEKMWKILILNIIKSGL